MDFDKLREVWKNNEDRALIDSDHELNDKLKIVMGTQRKIRQYFRFEMAIALIVITIGGAAVYFYGDLEPYFLKLFAIVMLGSVPISIRLYLSMKRFLGIDYTSQLKNNIIVAMNYLRTTVRAYYTLLVITVISLVWMSWCDGYFLQLPILWQVGVMSYFLLFFIGSVRLINKFYGTRVKELKEISEGL